MSKTSNRSIPSSRELLSPQPTGCVDTSSGQTNNNNHHHQNLKRDRKKQIEKQRKKQCKKNQRRKKNKDKRNRKPWAKSKPERKPKEKQNKNKNKNKKPKPKPKAREVQHRIKMLTPILPIKQKQEQKLEIDKQINKAEKEIKTETVVESKTLPPQRAIRIEEEDDEEEGPEINWAYSQADLPVEFWGTLERAAKAGAPLIIEIPSESDEDEDEDEDSDSEDEKGPKLQYLKPDGKEATTFLPGAVDNAVYDLKHVDSVINISPEEPEVDINVLRRTKLVNDTKLSEELQKNMDVRIELGKALCDDYNEALPRNDYVLKGMELLLATGLFTVFFKLLLIYLVIIGALNTTGQIHHIFMIARMLPAESVWTTLFDMGIDLMDEMGVMALALYIVSLFTYAYAYRQAHRVSSFIKYICVAVYKYLTVYDRELDAKMFIMTHGVALKSPNVTYASKFSKFVMSRRKHWTDVERLKALRHFKIRHMIAAEELIN